MFRKYNRYISFIGNPIIPVLCLFLMNCGPSAPPVRRTGVSRRRCFRRFPRFRGCNGYGLFLNRIADFSSLAVPRPDERMLLVSSHTDDATGQRYHPVTEQYKLDGTSESTG